LHTYFQMAVYDQLYMPNVGTLTDREKNYSQAKKEALSLIFGVTRLHSYFYGHKFTLVTDHKPLTTILNSKKGISSLSAHVCRDGLGHCRLTVITLSFAILTSMLMRQDNLSTYPEVFLISQIVFLPVTITELRRATRSDQILIKVYQFIKYGWLKQSQLSLTLQNKLTMEEGCVL